MKPKPVLLHPLTEIIKIQIEIKYVRQYLRSQQKQYHRYNLNKYIALCKRKVELGFPFNTRKDKMVHDLESLYLQRMEINQLLDAMGYVR